MSSMINHAAIPSIRRTARGLVAAVVAIACPAQSSFAQQDFPPPIRRVVVPDGVELEGRAPLLREGGILQKVVGRIKRDETLGVYRFSPRPTERTVVQRELILLPSRGLEDLVRVEKVVDTEGDRTLEEGEFEVSGRVLVYRGRNFLLPEAVVPMFKLDDVETTAPPSVPTPNAAGPDDDELAERLERELEARIGAVPRSLDFKEALPVTATPIDAGTRFVDRRGRISRDPASGVWRFVLAGDGSGSDVASVILLPCLELERLERLVRQADVRSEVLISGRISTFQGRVYLLPTLVRATRAGRGIGPDR